MPSYLNGMAHTNTEKENRKKGGNHLPVALGEAQLTQPTRGSFVVYPRQARCGHRRHPGHLLLPHASFSRLETPRRRPRPFLPSSATPSSSLADFFLHPRASPFAVVSTRGH